MGVRVQPLCLRAAVGPPEGAALPGAGPRPLSGGIRILQPGGRLQHFARWYKSVSLHVVRLQFCDKQVHRLVAVFQAPLSHSWS